MNKITPDMAAREVAATEHRDKLIADALADGRIAESSAEQWRADLAARPKAAEELLAKLTPGPRPPREEPISDEEAVERWANTTGDRHHL